MEICFILKKSSGTATIHKTASTWEEMAELNKQGFETFNRREYETIRAMQLNDDLWREIGTMRKKLGLPESGLAAKEFVAMASDPDKNREFILGTEMRFNKLAVELHARYLISPEVSGQLYNLVLCGHAVVAPNENTIYFASGGFSPLETDKNRIVIVISRRVTINSLHHFINANSGKLEEMFRRIYHESAIVTARDFRIYELRKTKKTFEKIADQIVREFRLDDRDAEMNYDSVRSAYRRTRRNIAKLFSPRRGSASL